MQTLLEGEEVELPVVGVGDDDLPVDDASLGQSLLDRLHHFGEVTGHRPVVAALDQYFGTGAEDHRPEPVPFGLVPPAVGN